MAVRIRYNISWQYEYSTVAQNTQQYIMQTNTLQYNMQYEYSTVIQIGNNISWQYKYATIYHGSTNTLL